MNQPSQQQDVPGHQAAMNPRPDCGEESYRGSGRLKGKAAIITGGDSGIGRAVAIAFAREGADVLISYLDEHEDARDTARLVEEAGRTVGTVAGGRVRPRPLPIDRRSSGRSARQGRHSTSMSSSPQRRSSSPCPPAPRR